jgi:hypothetical protein
MVLLCHDVTLNVERWTGEAGLYARLYSQLC